MRSLPYEIPRSALVCLGIALLACADSTTARTDVSKGSLEPSSLVVIGDREEDVLFQVVGGALVGGSIVIGERSNGAISFFDIDGRRQARTGGLGKGPGEFTRLYSLFSVEGRLYAFDLVGQRISWFDTDGALLGDIPTTPIEGLGIPVLLGVFEDHTFLVGAAVPSRQDQERGPVVIRPQFMLVRTDTLGTVRDTITTVSSTERYVRPFGRMGQTSSPLIFGRQLGVSVAGDRVYVVTNDSPAIDIWERTGDRLPSWVPDDFSPRTVTERDVEEARRQFLSGESPEANREEVFEQMPLPDVLPPYGWIGDRIMPIIHATEDGNVWVLRFGGLHDDSPEWLVFSRNGERIGVVTAESEVELLDVRDTLALVRSWDANDVEHVELRRISLTATAMD